MFFRKPLRNSEQTLQICQTQISSTIKKLFINFEFSPERRLPWNSLRFEIFKECNLIVFDESLEGCTKLAALCDSHIVDKIARELRTNFYTSSHFIFYVSVPLRSALAARLFIEIHGSPNIPATVPDQAAWWATYYNPSQQASVFETFVRTYETSIGKTSRMMFSMTCASYTNNVSPKIFAHEPVCISKFSK